MTKPDLTITLKSIRNAQPCADGWKKLLAGLGYANGKCDPDRVISLGDVALINDTADALWCVRALDWGDVEVRRAVISGAILPAVRRVSKHTKDARVHDAIAALTRWCAGDDTVDLLATAYTADAAYTAAAAYTADAYTADAAYAATYAAAAAADAAYTAYAATTAAYAAATYTAAAAAAAYTADAAYAARKIEREQQRQDIIAAFPPVATNQ